MKSQKQKAKSKKPRTRLTKQGQTALVAALKPYENKHPVYVALETLEGQGRRLLSADGFPIEMDTLAQYLHAPLAQRANRKDEERWLKNFQEHHLRSFPEDAGKVLTRRGALLKQILWQAERVREAIGSGDPEGAALHGIRLMQWAAKANIALEGSRRGKHSKKLMGIWYAIKELIEEVEPRGPKELWDYFAENYTNEDIRIDEPDFRGRVYFSPKQDKLFQVSAKKKSAGRQTVSVTKRTGIACTTFEDYYYEIKSLTEPSR